MPIDINNYIDIRVDKKTPEGIASDIERMQNDLINEYNENTTTQWDCDNIRKEAFFSQDITDNVCEPPQPDFTEPEQLEEPEITDYAECASDMANAVEEIGEELSEKAQLYTKTIECVNYLDEWLKNLEPVYEYNKTKISQNKKVYNSLDEVTGLALLTDLQTRGAGKILIALKEWSQLLGLDMDIRYRGKVIFGFKFRYKYKKELQEKITDIQKVYSDIGLPDFLNDSRDLRYEKYVQENAVGYLYDKYYALMQHPIDNFFTPAERGLVKNAKTAYHMPINEDMKEYIKDDKVAVEVYGSNGESSTYYVGDDEKIVNGKTNYKRYQEFFESTFKNEFDKRCDKKYEEIKKKLAYKTILALLKTAAVEEATLISKGSESFKSSQTFVEKYEKVAELQKRLKDIKNEIAESFSQEKIKEQVSNVDCFKAGNIEEAPFVEPDFSYGLNDPTLPNIKKICYWIKFCECATIYNLTSPYIELVSTDIDKRSGLPYLMNSMRYWAVGFICPSPAGLVKVPLPAIFVPLYCLATPMGILVLFLQMNGIFPTLSLMFIANDMSISMAATASCQGLTYGNDPFNFTDDDETNLLSIIGMDKSYKVPFMTPDELKTFIPDRTNALVAYAEKKAENGYARIHDFIEAKNLELWEKYEMLKRAQNGDFDIEDELNKIRNIFNDALDMVNFEAIEDKAFESIDDVRKFVRSILYSFDLPTITLPDNLCEVDPKNPLTELVKRVTDLLNSKVGLQVKPSDLRTVVVQILYDCLYNPKINSLLRRLPEKLTFINTPLSKLQELASKGGELGEKAKISINEFQKCEGEFAELKKVLCEIIDTAMLLVDPNIFYSDERFLKLLGVLSMDFNAYNCRTELDNPNTQSLAFLFALAQIIKATIEAMKLADFLQMISEINVENKELEAIEFARRFVLSLLTDIVKKYVPEIPIIDPTTSQLMLGSLTQTYKKIAKICVLLTQVDLKDARDFILNMLPKIVVDLNMYRDLLVEPIMQFIEEYLQKTEQSISDLSPIYYREMIRKEINMFFDEANVLLKPVIETYNMSVNTFKLLKKLKDLKLNFNTVDMALRPKTVAKKLAEAMQKVNWRNEVLKMLGLDGIPTVDLNLAELAILAMKVFGVSFNHFVVAAVCCLSGEPGKQMIRVLHPIAFCDDLPPYERLNLLNPLFCLFLDSFCYESKKYGGYCSNFLPIGT